ncbi:T9SS type A sorting domain-containing protein [Chitinophaga sancti]|uniref:T9SS type A sorting domain-containing protein n=1 Tax=Chitinophaga sancti TaxID=1004 RepID=UPI003F78C199
MPRILFILSFLLFYTMVGKSQNLPVNTCGVVYSYDAAGNRTQRMYVCNNAVTGGRLAAVKDSTTELPQVTALYPNPTTGSFKITFVKSLNNARIVIMNMNGRVLQQRTESGNVVMFDLSVYPAGMYWVQVQDAGHPYVFKVIKQ